MCEKEKMSLTEILTEIIKYDESFNIANTVRSIEDAISSGKTILDVPMIMIPLQLLKDEERNEMKTLYGWWGIVDNEELLESLAADGLKEPLGVIGPMDDGRYLVLDGKRRRNAIRWMGDQFWTTPNADTQKRIPCILLGDKNAPKVVRDIISMMENIAYINR